MFSLSIRDPFGCRGVSCVKLPATVTFPTDDRLLRRIAELRRALPKDNMKPLRNRCAPMNVVSVSEHRALDIEAQVASNADGPPPSDAHSAAAIDFAAALSDRRALVSKPTRGRPAIGSLASALT